MTAELEQTFNKTYLFKDGVLPFPTLSFQKIGGHRVISLEDVLASEYYF